MTTIMLHVTINGTAVNPWSRWGLTQNPFPQIGLAEYDQGERQLASLDGEPVRDADDIRRRLRGFDPAFVEGLIGRCYRPGQRTRITVSFPARGSA